MAQWLEMASVQGIGFRLGFVFMAVICLAGMAEMRRLSVNAGSQVASREYVIRRRLRDADKRY